MNWIKRNIFNLLTISFLLTVLFVPNAKAVILKGLMQIGLFKPDVEQKALPIVNLNGIQFKNSTGEIVDLGSLQGKVLFINFWATWCPPCRAEMPSIKKLFTKFENDNQVAFLFVDVDAKLDNSSAYLKNNNYNFPLYAMQTNVPEQIFSGSLPTTLIFDKQGRLSFKHEGIADYSHSKFLDFIEELKSLKN